MANYQRQYIQREMRSKSLNKPTVSPKKDYSQLYRNYQAEQARKRAQAQQAQADAQRMRMEQAQARARAEDAKRQAELQRQAEAQRRRQRSDAMTKRRVERRRSHMVSRQDTPETIAERYKTTPQSVVERAGVDRLRAGQVIPVYEPLREVTVEPRVSNQMADLSQYNQGRREGYQPSAVGGNQANLVEWNKQGALNAMPFASRFLSGVFGQWGEADPDKSPFLSQGFVDRSQEISDQLQRGSEGAQAFLDNGQRDIYGGWKDDNEFYALNQMLDERNRSEAKERNYIEATTQRWISQSVQYVYGMIESGGYTVEEGRNKFRNTVMEVDDYGNVTYKLGDQWMTFTEREFASLNPTTQEQLLGLGWQPNGLGQIVPVMLEDEGFGMGGYSYDGDYGYGGGGGFTPQEPTPKTGTRISRQSGGRFRQERGRLTAGSVPSAHWRI